MKHTIASVLMLTVCTAAIASPAEADSTRQSRSSIWQRGYVTGALESNSIYYLDDSVTEAVRPDGSFGSNNYLKVDFGLGKFEGGLQMEGYFPQIQGYPEQMKGFSLANRYLRFRDGGLSVTAGDFYDQFGSGLLFRAYEERSLGINNAIEGGRISYDWSNKLSVKAFSGFPKLFRSYNYSSLVSGADISANLMALAGSELFNLSVEGSFINRHQALESEWMAGVMSPNINGGSARLAFDWNGLSLKGEYVLRDADVCSYNGYNDARSQAILVEGAYTSGGLGVNLTFRKIENLGFQSDHNEGSMYTCLNYIPALTQQHTYSLASLNPYQSQMNGEFGGQADVFYFFPRRTTLGGPKGMRVHANFSTYYGPSPAPEIKKNELYFRDLTIDAERWFGRKVKAIVLYTWQTYNNRVGVHPSYEFRRSHTIVGNVTYKFNQKHALRAEYQHLWSGQGDGNWCAGTLEYTISPGWNFSISDMWNYGYTRIHYFNGGVSYSWERTRISLDFGRFREGYQCAGGVCRLIPAYTGANLSLTTSF